jgi:hypothetical protein
VCRGDDAKVHCSSLDKLLPQQTAKLKAFDTNDKLRITVRNIDLFDMSPADGGFRGLNISGSSDGTFGDLRV